MKKKADNKMSMTMAALVMIMALSASGCGADSQAVQPQTAQNSQMPDAEGNGTEIAATESDGESALITLQEWTVTPANAKGQSVTGSRTYHYDADGILQEMESASGGKSVVYHYEYDRSGNLIHEFTGAYDHTITYDEQNHVLTDVQTNTREDGSKMVLHKSYTYYENGKVATFTTDESGEEVIWTYGYNDEYYAIQKPDAIEYYDYDDRLIAESVLGQNKEEIPDGLYAYDEQGNLSGYEKASGTHMECENTYDPAGRLISSDRTLLFSDGSEGTYQELYEYDYDEAGRMTSKVYSKLPQDGDKTLVERYTWEYNDRGNLLREVYENESYIMENLYSYAD